ncbi:hypothetical protein [Actinoplanes sp. CA-252034]|uniref:hypothetical protein n=1 Tax=Actinoplanes sp. CA-252034 TaxID=3239906 RepID=UPI003D966678
MGLPKGELSPAGAKDPLGLPKGALSPAGGKDPLGLPNDGLSAGGAKELPKGEPEPPREESVPPAGGPSAGGEKLLNGC